MATKTFSIYMRVQEAPGKWPQYKAVLGKNGKIKPGLVWIGGVETKRTGDYIIDNSSNPKWIRVGPDALEAQRRQLELLGGAQTPPVQSQPVPTEIVAPAAPQSDKLTLRAAANEYYVSLKECGRDPKTIASYKLGVEPFITHCTKMYITDVTKADVKAYMGWLREQPKPARKHGNPDRTVANRILNVTIFLKAHDVIVVWKRGEKPKFINKVISAHSDAELGLLYSYADTDETFLMDFYLGSMARESEGSHCKFTDLTGTSLTVIGKQKKRRIIEIPESLANTIREREKTSKSEWLFPNGCGRPNENLLAVLQNMAKRAGAKFHTEIHKLRKTGASRLAAAGVAPHAIMGQLGHTSLAVTTRYLTDVVPQETKQKIKDAQFTMGPRLVKTGTDD
jgi:integrase